MNYINEETGEVYDDKYELVQKEMNELITDELTQKILTLQALEEEVERIKFSLKEPIKEVFKKYAIKSFKNDYINITYIAPTQRKSVDTEKLKRAGLYDEFSKLSDVKESIRIEVK